MFFRQFSTSLLIYCAMALGASGEAVAAPIVETATAMPGDTGDYTVYTGNRVIGTTFSLNTATHIDSVGYGAGRFGSGTIFGTIVAVDPVTGFPTSNHDGLASAALGSTIITVPASGGDAAGNLSLDLAAGTYGLVFGSGQFGAEGVGAFTFSNAIGDPQMFEWFFADNVAWEDFASDDVRLFANGSPIAVPEPWAPSIFFCGLACLIATRRRLPRHRNAAAGFAA